MDRTVRAISILTISYLAFGAYAFGVFLQQPLVAGKPLTVQAALEPFAYLVCLVVGNLAVFRAVASRRRREGAAGEENSLLIWAVALLLLVSFGAGLHTAGQLVEEAFHSHSLSNEPADDFAYRVAYWVEEYVSHYLMMIPYGLLLFVIARIELGREPVWVGPYEKWTIVMCGAVLGVCFAVGNFESAATDLVIAPMNLVLLVSFQHLRRQHAAPFWGSPFSACWAIATVLMVLLTVAFRATHGLTTQPTDLGFGVESQ